MRVGYVSRDSRPSLAIWLICVEERKRVGKKMSFVNSGAPAISKANYAPAIDEAKEAVCDSG